MKKKLNRVVACTTAGAMICGSVIGTVGIEASDADVQKDETVYVKVNPSGDTNEVIVSDWLKNNSGEGKIEDSSDLKDIENVKGEETFSQNGDELVWDAEGDDIFYQGSTSKELPIGMKVRYYLDGKEVSADELKGKSGRVKISYQFENYLTDGDTCTPFLLASGILLNTDKFSNIEVTNGKLISDGSRNIVIGFGFPGVSDTLKLDQIDCLKDVDLDIPSGFDIEADVTDFAAPMGITVAEPMSLEDLDLDLNFDDIKDRDDLDKKIQELKDGAKDLVDGTGTLADGVQTLKDSCVELIDGMNELDDGMGTLNDGAQTLNNKKGELVSGAQQLAGGLNTLNSKKDALLDGTKQLSEGAAALNDKSPELVAGVTAIVDGIDQMYDKDGELKTGINTLVSGSGDLYNGTKSLEAGVNAYTAGVSQVEAGVKTLESSVNEYTTGVQQLAQGLLAGLNEKDAEIKGYFEQVQEFAAGTAKYVSGVETLTTNLAGLSTNASGMLQLIGALEAQSQAGGAATTSETAAAAVTDETEETVPQETTTTVTVDNSAAIASLEASIAGNQAVLNSLYDVQGKVGIVPSELVERYSGTYGQYVGQLDNCISQLENDIASQQAALAALQNQTQEVTVTTDAADEASVSQAAVMDVPAGSIVLSAAQTTSLKQILGGVVALNEGAADLVPTVSKEGVPNNAMILKGGAAKLENGAEDENIKQLYAGLSNLLAPNKNYPTGKVDEDNNPIYLNNSQALAYGISQVKNGLALVTANNTSLNTGASDLKNGMKDAKAGTKTLKTSLFDALKQLHIGGHKVEDGTTAYTDGVTQLKDGTATLNSTAKNELAPGIEQLADGGNQLSSGVNTLSGALSQLASGSSQLKDGTSQLAEGGTKLDDGVTELNDGAKKLDDGMKEFDEKAIQKIIKFTDEDLKDLLDAVDRYDAMKEAAGAYTSFSSSSDNVNGKVKFVIVSEN